MSEFEKLFGKESGESLGGMFEALGGLLSCQHPPRDLKMAEEDGQKVIGCPNCGAIFRGADAAHQSTRRLRDALEG